MSSTVRIPINSDTKLKISIGSVIHANTDFGESSGAQQLEELCLSEILHIKPKTVSRYLKISIGGEVSQGEILAEKKTFLSSYVLKSPYNGILKELDLKKGTLLISSVPSGKKALTIPVDGKVVGKTSSHMVVEVNGTVYEGVKGQGKEADGKLLYFPHPVLGTLDRIDDAADAVIACGEVSRDAVVKLEVIGVKGLIVGKNPGQIELPFIQVAEEILKKIAGHHGRNVWLRPKELEIVICK